MKPLIHLFALLIWATVVLAATYDDPPKVECLGDLSDPTCFTLYDENRNNRVDRTPIAATMTANGADYTAAMTDFSCVGNVVVVPDATALPGGFALTKQTPISYTDGECGIFVNATPATYYAYVLIRNETGQSTKVYLKSDSNFSSGFQQEDMSLVPVTNPYSWHVLKDAAGAPRVFTRSGPSRFYLRFEQNIYLQAFYLSPNPLETATPCPPGACGDATPIQPDITIKELGVASAPTGPNDAVWAEPSVARFIFTGPEVGTPCGGNYEGQIIWEDGATKWGYIRVGCSDDSDRVLASGDSDTSTHFGGAGEKTAFRWNTPASLSSIFNGSMRDVRASPDDKFDDGDWSAGDNNTFTLTPDFINTVVGETSGAGWSVMIKFDLGAIVANTMGKGQLAIYDRDASPTTNSVHWRGNSITDPTQFGNILWSSATIDVAAPTTPVVANFVIPVGQITSNSAQGTATTTVPGTCKIYARQITGVTVANATHISAGSVSNSGNCQETITNLTAGSWYGIMGVTNSVGVTGTSSGEVSFTVPLSTLTHWVGPTNTGLGNCSSAVNLCTPNKVWTTALGSWKNVGPGDVVGLTDGVYNCGSNCTINPPDNLNGTSTNRITIKAINDGSVRTNGGGTSIPIQLKDNDWFIIEGINAHNGSCEVVHIGTGADNNIIRRVVAWDAAIGNCMVFGVNNNAGNILEDVAGFGNGRKIFQYFSGNGPYRVRRAWARWESNDATPVSAGGPAMAYSVNYSSYNTIYENVIGTWNTTQTNPVDEPFGLLSMDGVRGGDDCINSKYLGSIGYLRTADVVGNWTGTGAIFVSGSVDCYEARDIVLVNQSGHTNLRPIRSQPATQGDWPANCGANCQRALTNITKVGWTATDSISNEDAADGTSTTNVVGYASQAVMSTNGASPFQTTVGNGGRVCFRYVNGVLTSTPLWPWPMNQRIIDAMKQAGKTPVDVTATMESLLGTIPAACRS